METYMVAEVKAIELYKSETQLLIDFKEGALLGLHKHKQKA